VTIGTQMADAEYLALVKRGTEAVNAWRSANRESVLQLSGSDLAGVHLPLAWLDKARLTEVVLRGANLRGARLERTSMRGADLREADLTKAELSGADLSGADLRGAKLCDADLHGVTFDECLLDGADLSDASCGLTTYLSVDLSGVSGLDSVQHIAPSKIDVDTLFLSKGSISTPFLRGCGVPEVLITYLASLTGRALEFFSCFISFGEADDVFSRRLYEDLQEAGIRCWRWKEDARWGRLLIGEIDQAIRRYDKLIVVCSRAALKSEAVVREIERAVQIEHREGREVLFPIRLDDAVFEWRHPLQADLVRRYVGNFRAWTHPTSYTEGLRRLVRDLRSDAHLEEEGPNLPLFP
jgi:TIR domain/Pentapeptide repeats (8 copies)